MSTFSTILKALKYALPVLFIAAFAIIFAMLVKNTRELERVKNNYDVEMMHEYSVQQEITKKELKKYFKNELNSLKEFGVKPGQIENIINVSYLYKDSTIYHDTLVYVYDTITDEKYAPFDVAGSCWNVSGIVFDDAVEVNNVTMNDTLLIALYKEKRKCLFEKRKVKAIAISSCMGDTLAVMRNLKIQK